VTALLNVGADMDHLNKDGVSALMAAAKAGRVDPLTLLVDRGAHKELENSRGATALTVAVEAGQLAPLNTLLRRGTQVGFCRHRLPYGDLGYTGG
jgi:ankyrin repeat protein